MSVILDVRSVGFVHHLKNDPRSPESFAFPACMTSLMESMGEDVRRTTIHAHNREYEKRRLYDAVLAATGMSFGLLWHPEICPSSFDLTQVNDHDRTIRLGFEYVGYACEIMERGDDNFQDMRERIVRSLDAGRPVLAFGIVGPPECAIICGYGDGGDTLYGWSHFQSQKPEDCAENGMFRISGWHKDLWKIVLCGDKSEPQNDLKDLIRRGIDIASARELYGLYAGAAAYDAWAAYAADPAYEAMDDKTLKGKYWFHSALVGNHAEARAYLGGFLHDAAGDDEALHEIAGLYLQIHDTCWKVWAAAGGVQNAESFRVLRDGVKRAKLLKLIREIEAMDFAALKRLEKWLAR